MVTLEFTEKQILGLIPAQAFIDFDRAKEVLEKVAESQAEITRQEISDKVRSWLVSKISDAELCEILGISKNDWDILYQEKQVTWDSYIGSLVDECDNPNCKVKQSLNSE